MDNTRAFTDSRHRIAAVSVALREQPTAASTRVTEAVLGEPVQVLEMSGGWAHVSLPLQPTRLHPVGYPGWLPEDALRESDELPCWQTVVERAPVRDGTGRIVAELPIGSLLPEHGPDSDTVPIRLPSCGEGHVWAADVARWPLPTAGRDTILRVLGIWKHQPYVWGGTSSAAGPDCSGLTYRTYQRAGLCIPRDADDQFTMAPRKTQGALDGARPGDLVFFQQPHHDYIDHVGIYPGDSRYLSARMSKKGISVDPIYSDLSYVGWASYLPD